MKAPASPISYALAAFVLLPFAVLALFLVAILLCYLAVLVCFAWPVLPFTVYAATRKKRNDYGKTAVPIVGEPGHPDTGLDRHFEGSPA